jgi:SSS family solute:Na+ symporter
MIDYLPISLRGLMVAGFLAAYMSTIGTHLNLGASYLTNDIYRRFIKPDATDAHYVVVSRFATLIVMVLAMIGAYANNSVGDAWKYLFNLTAGVGLVMILRWYWWRVNAWSEISALVTSALVSNALILLNVFRDANATAEILLVTVPITTLVWLAVTFLTSPDEEAKLVAFFERVRPSPFGWGKVARLATPGSGEEPLAVNGIDWLAGCGLVYGTLFGIGKVVLGDLVQGLAYLALALVCAGLIAYNVIRARGATIKPATPRFADP